ncbi:MAG: peptidoglycan DD-metalloendopeptidase family protein [Bdellovibrionales bacterium]|nr:peptidoglycan DD-metalloendopeptidase family protein [Ramlibacter sp.]
MLGLRSQGWKLAVIIVTLGVLAGCASRGVNRAPVEDRGASVGRPAVVIANDAPLKPPPSVENAGKPGYYTVKPGDTLIRIGLDAGQNWRDIVRWNNIENPNLIEVGQVLRVAPPGVPQESVALVRPVPQSAVSPPGSATPYPAASSARPAAAASGTSGGANGEDDVAWIWPVNGGNLIAGFDEVKNKGLDIGGKVGESIVAASDGRVVYAGAGLRGYGNLIILKHNNTFLTAYAHNQTLLVKEDQTVRKGQKIAEMGSSDADRVKLHFEIRKQGKPVDPAQYLPAR